MHPSEILFELVSDEETLLIVAIPTAIVAAVLIKSVTRVFTSGARERTKREIAAYIAEGSMTPEQGERLLRADKPRSNC